MNVFIVRPFGVKPLGAGTFDFDAMEAGLIRPVIDALGLRGGTTAEITRAGNIRDDMIELLLRADLVIADISIHNANVYYELGVRHALRDKATVLIRCAGDDVPFDIKTDRYLEYDRADPAGTKDALQDVVAETLRHQVVDSPVYQVLPALPVHDPAVLYAVPRDFREAVTRACADEDVPLLGLLGDETRGTAWRLAGLRLVGAAQFSLKAYGPARATWEDVRRERPDDVPANLRLGTIYQRLGKSARADQALERVLEADPNERARSEALAQRARGKKEQWIERWRSEPPEERRRHALRSPLLGSAIEDYREACLEDPGNYYPGLNALAGMTVQLELARAMPELWAAQFDEEEDEDPDRALRKLERQRKEMAAVVSFALGAARRQASRADRQDVWLDLSEADLKLLTSRRPERVRQEYYEARDLTDNQFAIDSAVRQIAIYRDLGVLEENTAAACAGLDVEIPPSEPPPPPGPRDRVIVATGHRIDALDRPAPRFPQAGEARARAEFARLVQSELETSRGTVSGLAGLASGTDILFHEVCQELGVPTEASLAMAREQYLVESVADGGPEWVARFRKLEAELQPHVLAETSELPRWIPEPENYSIFQRSNIWLLEKALAASNADVTVLALWDGEAAVGPGGTADMVSLARERDAHVVVIDTNELFADLL